jgi:rod shape-determining protein MreD
MARAALDQRRIGQGPIHFASYIPAGSVVAGSLLSALPIVSTTGWYPDFGYMILLAWRLLRSDPWPPWWAAPLGFVNDLFTGNPIGFSIALWSATMLALDLIDRRTMWRDYWIEWGLAGVFLTLNEWLQWRLAGLVGARVPLAATIPPILVSVCTFPLAAWVVARVDRWRLGR